MIATRETVSSARAEESGFDLVPVELLVNVPAATDEHATVCVTGDHPTLGAWRPESLRLARVGHREFHARFEVPRGTRVRFRITLGGNGRVEADADGNVVAERTVSADAGALLLLSVDRWAHSTR